MSADSLKLFDAIAEQCCCSICKGYLSCGPIRILPSGSRICGHCNPVNTDVSVYRDLVLENILSMISFPCCFRKHGCSERVLFGHIAGHESKCSYQIFSCPASCCWHVPGLKLFEHFKEKHPELIKENAEIKLKIAESSDGILMVVKGTVTFIIKYLYDCSDNNLKYDIRYHANYSQYDVFFKINLINDSEPECSVNLKSKKCAVFDDTFYDVQNTTVLNLKKFYDTLDYPDCIVISIKITVTQTSTNVESLNLLKCPKCCNYLIPPLFDLGENVVCWDCGKNDATCTPSNNKELLQLVTEIKFPCRWRNCDVAVKSDVYKMHELSCKFYMHRCLYYNCGHRFVLSDAIVHYQNYHNNEYSPDKIVCKTLFSQTYDWKYIFTINNNTVIFLRYKMVNSSDCNTFIMTIFSTNPTVITGSVNFEHQHCTLKPKPFNFASGQEVNVKLNQLPPCFKENDELTITVTPQQ